jgi:hypothetical protein
VVFNADTRDDEEKELHLVALCTFLEWPLGRHDRKAVIAPAAARRSEPTRRRP